MAKKAPKRCQERRDRIKKWDDAWKYNRDQYYEMSAFVLGDQWRDDEAEVFKTYKKIPLTANHLAPLANHVIGEQRQNTPQLEVEPDDGVQEQTAEVREGLVHNISLDSKAKIVYQQGFQQAFIGGFGAYGIKTEYDNDFNFDQNIILYGIKDPCKCYWDISAESPCKTDGMFAGTRTKMSRKLFAALYGEELERKIGNTGSEDSSSLFSDDDSITMINDYERKYTSETIYRLSNDETITAKEMQELPEIEVDGVKMFDYNGEPVTVINKRDIPKFTVKHTLQAGDYEIETNDFPSKQLPIVFIDMNSYYDKQGRQICRPFLKDAKDAQRYINYIRTQCAYILKISRYDQFMGSRANVKAPDTQLAWRNPGNVQGMIVYDESPNGNKPEQLTPPELSQSLIQQYQQAVQDIHMTTGIFDTQMGQQGNEISGDAIDARTERGSFNTFVPFDSLNRAIAVGGEIINEMIPIVYDSERKMTINLKDKGKTPITINKRLDPYGNQIENDMTQGRYKIRLMPGPSLEGQKKENLNSMQAILNAQPETFNMIADLYVENLPMGNTIELRNRLRSMVPPEIIEAGKTGQPIPKKPPQPSPEIMLQMQELKLKEQDIQRKQQELQLKAIESHQDMSLEWEKLNDQRLESAARLKEMELRYQAETNRTIVDANIAHADNIIKILTHNPKMENTHANK